MGLTIYLASETSFCITSGALWKRQYTKLHVIIIVWPLAVPGGVYCAFHAKSVAEVYLACIPLLLVIGILFCFLGEVFFGFVPQDILFQVRAISCNPTTTTNNGSPIDKNNK